MQLFRLRYYPINPLKIREKLRVSSGKRLHARGIVGRATYKINRKSFLFVHEYHTSTIITIQDHDAFQERAGSVDCTAELVLPGRHLRGVMDFLSDMKIKRTKLIEYYQEVWAIGLYTKVVIHWWPDLYPILEIESPRKECVDYCAEMLGLSRPIEEELVEIYHAYSGWDSSAIETIDCLSVFQFAPKEYGKHKPRTT